MTAILLAVLIMAHFLIFITSIAIFIWIYRKQNYGRKEVLLFSISFFSIGILGFFITNHLALLALDKSVILAMGYSAVPIVQISFSLFAYPVVMLLNHDGNIKYAPVLLGIIASAPFTFTLTSTLSHLYWQLLAVGVYG